MAEDFLARAHQFFLSRGYPPHAAAALAANAIAESGGNTRAEHDKGTGVGIYGFRDPTPGTGRKTALFNFAKARGLDPYAESTQLEFAAQELETSEKKAGDALKASKDYREAQAATLGFLRPQGYSEKNPTASHNYAGRWNAGATLAGVAPVLGPTIAAAGSADTPVVSPAPTLPAGLLAESTPAPATPLSGLKADKEKEQAAAYESLTRQGMALMAKEEEAPAPPVQPAGAGGLLQASNPVPLPDFTKPAPSLPDFLEMLSQQRLTRRA